MQKKLNEFVIGESGVVCAIGGDGKIRRRLFDMGVTPGADVTLRKKAPLGDPLEVTIRGYELTLRNAEAEVILMDGCFIKKTKSVKEATYEFEMAKTNVINAKSACKADKSESMKENLQKAKASLKDAKEELKSAKAAEKAEAKAAKLLNNGGKK